MKKRAGVIVFPGSNCDRETYYVLKELAGFDTYYIWHEEKDLSKYSLVVLPGGFTYGDYLRAGAIARFSPVIKALEDYITKEMGFVMGICNGFQILTEAGFLRGAFTINLGMRFIAKRVKVRVERDDTPFTSRYRKGDILEIPIAHREGRVFLREEDLRELRERGLILLRYHGENPNGSVDNIAGMMSENGMVFGLMPHPERNSERILGTGDGLGFFLSIKDALEA
jgi:phosphoribosylformylglycinamidine synthase